MRYEFRNILIEAKSGAAKIFGRRQDFNCRPGTDQISDLERAAAREAEADLPK